ncbi:MAG: hypothetical protein PUA56_01920 [Bacillales bacterium]|nr:hypothetical protein [Bacillales bacterium]
MKKNIFKFLSIATILTIAAAGVSCGGVDIPTETPKKEAFYTAYCEFAGNFYMAGKGDLGPLPARTEFYEDHTWEAHATGKAMYCDFEGSWEYANGALTLKLLFQDGYAKEGEDQVVTVDSSDDRVWSWTLSHQDDRGTGYKYHKNHASRYAFLKAMNDKLGTTEVLPAEPTFTLSFDNGIWQSGWFGDTKVGELTGTMNSITVKAGEEITLPSCGFTRDGYTFSDYTIMDSFKTKAKAGDKFVMPEWDITVNSNFVANQ